MRWDPLAQHQQMVNLYNYQSAEQNRTFDVFDHVDDWHYADTHDWIKFEKHGYGKATDHACREIRHGRISRQIGKQLSDHYGQQKPKNMELLLEWLGLNEQSLNYLLNPNAIKRMGLNDIELSTRVDSAPSKTSAETAIREIFQPTSSLELDQQKPSPVIIGKVS